MTNSEFWEVPAPLCLPSGFLRLCVCSPFTLLPWLEELVAVSTWAVDIHNGGIAQCGHNMTLRVLWGLSGSLMLLSSFWTETGPELRPAPSGHCRVEPDALPSWFLGVRRGKPTLLLPMFFSRQTELQRHRKAWISCCLWFFFHISARRPSVKTEHSQCYHPRKENEGMWAFGTMLPGPLVQSSHTGPGK